MTWPAKKPPHADATEKRTLGKDVFRRCDACGATSTREDFEARFEVCPACGHHHPLAPERYRALVLDDGALEAWDEHLSTRDPLAFDDGKRYPDRVAAAKRATGATEAVETGAARIAGTPVAWGCFRFAFMGGSMGSVVGERVTRLFERALASELPVVLLTASGGARMQEGILSLMQMAKTVGALERFRAARRPYVSVMLGPTTGGVAASFAFLGDVNLAEPGARIGFAGPRVIGSTIQQKLPDDFQTAEFVGAHGMLDAIVARAELRERLASLLGHLGGARPRA